MAIIESHGCCSPLLLQAVGWMYPNALPVLITRWMHHIVGWAWASAHAEGGPGSCTDYHQNVTEPQATEYQKVLMPCTTQELWVRPNLAKASCTQAGPANTAGHVEMAWTDQIYAIFLACATGRGPDYIAVARRDLIMHMSPVIGTMSQSTKTNSIIRLPCGYLRRSGHWIGKSTSNLHICCHHQEVDCSRLTAIIKPFLHNAKACKIRVGSDLR